MLDHELKQQLTQVFQVLDKPVELKIAASTHPEQTDLRDFLTPLTECSPYIKVTEGHIPHPYPSQAPYFEIWTERGFSGIRFAGIPTGHEFSSLVLAILNANGKGKMPDDSLKNRITNLKGPAHLITYMSLTCENCPDVVQALNLISLLNGSITHEVRDGQYFQNELNELGIMGVPTVVWNQTIIHAGRANILDMVSKLEQNLGQQAEAPQEKRDLGRFDVVVIGGGPSGVSSAIYTVRKGLKTAIIFDKTGGQVSETRGIENMISIPYTEGPKLSGALLEHLEHYPVERLYPQRVKALLPLEPTHPKTPWRIELENGNTLEARLVILSTGAKWKQLGVPGEKEYLGRGVAYCPHCDGPFYKGKHVAVIGGGNSGVEAAIDLAGIVGHVTLLEYNAQLKADQILVDKLKSLPNVTIITQAQTKELKGDGKKIMGLHYVDRASGESREIALDGVFIQIGLVPNSELVKEWVKTSPYGEILVDEKCRTSHPTILAAGDVTNVPYKQIIIAMGEGAKAGLTAFEKLVLDSP